MCTHVIADFFFLYILCISVRLTVAILYCGFSESEAAAAAGFGLVTVWTNSNKDTSAVFIHPTSHIWPVLHSA